MNKLTEVQKAYLAGFIDGEGCIVIERRDNRYHVLRIHISQANKPVLCEMQEMTGVGVVCRNNIRKSENHRQCYHLVFTGTKAEDLLLTIFDYLFVKRKEAQIALDFRAFKKAIRLNKENSKFILERRESFRQNLKAEREILLQLLQVCYTSLTITSFFTNFCPLLSSYLEKLLHNHYFSVPLGGTNPLTNIIISCIILSETLRDGH